MGIKKNCNQPPSEITGGKKNEVIFFAHFWIQCFSEETVKRIKKKNFIF